MKYLIILLISLPCFANQVPLSEAERYISAMPNGVPPLYTCSDKPEEPCFDASNITWEYAEIVDNIVNGSPIYGPKENVLACTEAECKALVDHCKAFPEHQFFYAATSIGLGYEAYCSKVVGYEQVVVGKKLQNNEAKKLKHFKDIEDAKLAKTAQKLKAKADINKATTIAQLRKAMEDYILSIE